MTLKEFFPIKIVLIALAFTVAFGIISFIAWGVFLTVGWVKVTSAEHLPPYDPATNTMYACAVPGIEAPPFGFPFAYYKWTNESVFRLPSSIPLPIWRIEACGTPSYVNPLAFLGDFVLFLAGIHLYRRWKVKKN